MTDNFIKSIGIQNFKSLEYLKIEKLSHFNLFIGTNNIGKTNILEALAFASGTYPRTLFDDFAWEYRREFPQKVEDYRRYFHQMDTEKEIMIRINTEIKPQVLIVDYLNTDPIHIVITQNTLEKEIIFYNSWYIENQKLPDGSQRKIARSLLEAPEEVKEKFKKHIEAKYAERNLDEQVILEGKKFVRLWYVAQRGLSDREKILLDDLRLQEDVIEFARRIDPRIETIRPDGKQLKVYYKGISLPFTLNELGAGFSKIIKLYLATRLDDIDAILCDEITDGLHPDAIQILLDFMVPELVKRNIQLFATTHSHDILQKIAEYPKKEKESIAVYFLYQAEANNQIQAHRYSQEAVAQLQDFADLRRV